MCPWFPMATFEVVCNPLLWFLGVITIRHIANCSCMLIVQEGWVLWLCRRVLCSCRYPLLVVYSMQVFAIIVICFSHNRHL